MSDNWNEIIDAQIEQIDVDLPRGEGCWTFFDDISPMPTREEMEEAVRLAREIEEIEEIEHDTQIDLFCPECGRLATVCNANPCSFGTRVRKIDPSDLPGADRGC